MDTKPHGLQISARVQISSRIISFFSFIALAISFVIAGVSVPHVQALAQENSLPLAADTGPSAPAVFHIPANDNFADAINIPVATSGSGTGTNANATGELGEPFHFAPFVVPLNSVWWKFTAPQNGTLEFDTNGSTFDTVLAVYTGIAFIALTAVASDDNGGTGNQSRVLFTVSSGTTYYIAVEGRTNQTGNIAWAYTFFGQPPGNDNFADAIDIPAGASGSGTGTNIAATDETGEPIHHTSNAAPLNSVWWKFTAIQSGSLEINSNGSTFDTIIAVYTGSAVNALTSVASDDNGGLGLQSLVTFNISAGMTYYVAIEGFASDTGLIAWAYTFTPPPATSIVASILPNARATQIPGTVTAFASIQNFGTATAFDCSITLPAPIPGATFLYQTTDVSNVPTGTPNTTVDIPAGLIQGFYFAIEATTAFSQNINLVFDCTNTDPVTVISGVNTFSMTASTDPIADMVAIAATIGNTGYIIIPTTTGQQLATAAVVNIGTTGTIVASVTEQAVSGTDPNMPATLLICRTDVAGVCPTGFAAEQTFTATANTPYYFTILAIGSGTVANDPAINRAHLYFRDGADVVGATSVAVRTAP